MLLNVLNMDLSTPLIFVIIFIVACLSLLLVYKFGIKEKSYEEALAEQRQHTNVLLGAKPKAKDKKNKKAAKKSKDKISQQQSELVDSEKDDVNSENSQASKLHVEFKDKPEEVPIEEVPIKEVKRKHIKKVRSILNKKDSSLEKVVLDFVKAPIANHFEENPPKDDFELMRLNSKNDLHKAQEPPAKEKPSKEKKQPLEVPTSTIKNKKNKQLSSTIGNSTNTNTGKSVSHIEKPAIFVTEARPEEKAIEVVTSIPQTNGIVIGNRGKEKKKKKSEFNSKQQLTADRDGLINSVRNADLSKNEVQLLIDLLLNKQLEAPNIVNEWSEGKSDPVQKLKKQLSEKERLLIEEQEALVGAQARLKEVRAEQQTEKVQFQQKIRGLEEMLQNKQLESQTNANRVQATSQKIQQLQGEINAEIMQKRKLTEEIGALQMQIQQYEVSIAQIQETDSINSKLRSDLEQLSAQNRQLHAELQQTLSENDQQRQHFLVKINNLEKNMDQESGLNQQLKLSCQELERNLELALRKENEWKIEISKLNTTVKQEFEEKRTLEFTIDKLNDELRLTKKEITELTANISELNSDLQKLPEEKSKEEQKHVKLENELHEVEILNLTNELSSIKSELVLFKNEMQQKERKFKIELDNSDRNCFKLQKELEEQRAKNNELRTKNWKVMEALKEAENKNNDTATKKQSDVDVKKLTTEIISKEQESQRLFIQRLFPEIEDLKAVCSEDWQAEFGKHIKYYVSNLKNEQQRSPPSSPQKSQEVSKLQAQLQVYKEIIDDTEAMLNHLQSNIENEEIKWRNQLAAKEAEIQSLKENKLTELQKTVSNLEEQLSQQVLENQRLSQECQLLKNQRTSQPNVKVADSAATIEKLSEEVNRLREQLSLEQNKNGDVNICLKAQSNYTNSTNGSAFIEENGRSFVS